MFCTKCGCENNDNARFCQKCGAGFEQVQPADKIAVAQPIGQAVALCPPKVKKSKKKLIIIGVIVAVIAAIVGFITYSLCESGNINRCWRCGRIEYRTDWELNEKEYMAFCWECERAYLEEYEQEEYDSYE